MKVTQRYKTVSTVTENAIAVVLGCLLLCSGPILSALGLIGG